MGEEGERTWVTTYLTLVDGKVIGTGNSRLQPDRLLKLDGT